VKIGYARASTDDQNLDLQIDALKAAGCDEIFEERGVSGAQKLRVGLGAALDKLGKGDVLAVWKLDRLGRSLPHLIETLEGIGERGGEFQSLFEAIDTTTPGGWLVFHMLGSLAEFERALISERTREGMKAAKKRGHHVGRPRRLDSHKIDTAKRLIETGQETQAGAAALVNVSISTLRRALRDT
jgi:DNA invertase Pin-like site-specific DNA recombinase